MLLRSIAVVATLMAAGTSAAPSWPARPLRLIAPFPPAGPTDVLARAIAGRLSERWGQQVVIDNRPGAAGNIGSEIAARAAPDGYTLLMGTIATHAINQSLYAKPGFDPQKDFIPVALAAQTPSAVVVHPSLPARTFAELVALARAKPGGLNYAHAGVGTLGHLAIELLRMQAGVQVASIPYKGTGPALTDTISGQTAFMITSTLTVLSHVRSGRLRALAVTSVKRTLAAPEIPTVVESGYPDYVVVGWAGLFAPAGMPHPLVQRLNADVNAVLATSDTRERLLAQGSEPNPLSLEAYAAFVRGEAARWAKVVREAGVRAD